MTIVIPKWLMWLMRLILIVFFLSFAWYAVRGGFIIAILGIVLGFAIGVELADYALAESGYELVEGRLCKIKKGKK